MAYGCEERPTGIEAENNALTFEFYYRGSQ
jgi:hypothetical protein